MATLKKTTLHTPARFTTADHGYAKAPSVVRRYIPPPGGRPGADTFVTGEKLPLSAYHTPHAATPS